MLRVSTRSAGGEAYYLQVAPGTGTGTEAAGRWAGGAARTLGLTGEVEDAPLRAVLQGRHPDGRVLSPTHDRVRVAAYDLTFCAPKSVSLLAALAPDDVAANVRAGHDEAVAAAIGYVERRAAAVRGEPGARRVPAPVSGLVAAAFVHRVSRALDPHLHTHVVVANLGAGPDGRWRALDGRGLFAHRATVDALYHAHLRHALGARLGLAWEPPRHGRADVLGVGRSARLAFSRRSAAIAAELARTGWSGPRAAEVAAATTRPRRRPDVPVEALVPEWRDRAIAAGLTGPALERVLGRRLPGRGRLPDAEAVADALVGTGRPVTRRLVVRAAGRAAAGGAAVADVEAVADAALDRVAGRAGHAPDRWRPGVAEPRLVPLRSPADELLARQLARRGMHLPPARGLDRGSDGPGLGR